MEVVLYSKNIPASLFLTKCIKSKGHNCSCAYTLGEMIRLIRAKDPEIVFSDTREINLFGFDVDKHLVEMEATFAYYDLYADLKRPKELPRKDIYSSVLKKYLLFVEIQHYKPSKPSLKNQVLKENKLQHHHIVLLQYFFKNPNENISAKKLIKLLWKEESISKLEILEEHQSTLYSYISQIKKFIKKTELEVDIQRSGKGCYCLNI